MDPEPSTIESRATDWVIRLDAGPLSGSEQRELDEWLAADVRHHGAFVRARSEWLNTGRLAALMLPDTRKVPTRRVLGARVARLLGSRYALAAGLAMLAISVGVLYLIWWTSPFFVGQTYASEIGEIRNIRLVDGSELTLNTNTRAKVQFKETQRDVALEQGEALFKVAHDATRPFIVHANDVEIKAVGTAFTVRIDHTRTDVLVTEGTVEITRVGAPPQRVSANHQATLASPESRTDIQPVQAETITRELAWREGKVGFAGEPLSSAVAEINRHSRNPIIIDNPELASRPVVGMFNANDSEAFAKAVAATFGASVEGVNGEIHIREDLKRDMK